jgi:hypothetical protein
MKGSKLILAALAIGFVVPVLAMADDTTPTGLDASGYQRAAGASRTVQVICRPSRTST